MRRSSFFYRWRGELGALVGAMVLAYLAFWHRWLLVMPEPAEDLMDVAGVCLAFSGHLVRVWALSYIGPVSRTTRLQAPRLVKEGPYGLVRHPLYLGNWLIATGLFVVAHDALLLAVGPLLVLGWYLKISAEEEWFLRERFGQEYEEYARKVPRLFPLKSPRGVKFDFLRAAGLWVRTKEYQALVGTTVFVLVREMIEMVGRHRLG